MVSPVVLVHPRRRALVNVAGSPVQEFPLTASLKKCRTSVCFTAATALWTCLLVSVLGIRILDVVFVCTLSCFLRTNPWIWGLRGLRANTKCTSIAFGFLKTANSK